MTEEEYSKTLNCGHCNNTGRMEVVASHIIEEEEFYGSRMLIPIPAGDVFQLVLCSTCGELNLLKGFWNSEYYDNPNDVDMDVVFPPKPNLPSGLPPHIAKAFKSAQKVRTVEANAYAVLIGRLLEMVCKDRNAKGNTLFKKLEFMAEKGEIPQKLIGVTDGLRKLRNIGAHATLGELSSAEVPLLDSLTRSILEYIYTAPHLVETTEENLKKLKNRD